MDFTVELKEQFDIQSAKVDSLNEAELYSLISDGRNNKDSLVGAEQFRFAYALLKKDFIDEAYSYLHHCFMKYAALTGHKGDNIYLSDELKDFVCGMVCCTACEECIDGGGGSCCGMCCVLFVVAYCMKDCCGCKCGMGCLDSGCKWLCECCGFEKCCRCT